MIDSNKKLKAFNFAGLIALLLLVACGLALLLSRVSFKILDGDNYIPGYLLDAFLGVSYLSIIFYGSIGYRYKKVPLLRICMIFFAVTLSLISFFYLYKYNQMVVYSILIIFPALLIVFISGSFKKYKLVNYLSTLVLVLYIASLIYISVKFSKEYIGLNNQLIFYGFTVSPLIIWIALYACYLTYYYSNNGKVSADVSKKFVADDNKFQIITDKRNKAKDDKVTEKYVNKRKFYLNKLNSTKKENNKIVKENNKSKNKPVTKKSVKTKSSKKTKKISKKANKKGKK